MATTTNVPAIQWTPEGIVLPSEAQVLAGVQADQQDAAKAAGKTIRTNLQTPLGQLAQSETAVIGDKNNDIANIVAQMDPDTASGRYQDALARIYFIERIEASGTVVTATCIGAVGATIPLGSLAQDQAGYIYASIVAATIPASGSVDIDFQCQTTGPIECPAGSLNRIYKAVTGWDTLSNAAAGTPGTDVETRADFEYRRRQSVAKNSVNMVGSIRGAVLEVDNVLDAYVVDNPLGTSVNYGPTNYPLKPHSVLVSVVGGNAADVANAIWSKKSGGCDYNGNTSFTILETDGYTQPYPQYVVTWLTPTALPIFYAVSLVNNPLLPADIVTQVQNAIVAAFNGADNGPRARIGSTLYAGRYYAGVSAIDLNVEILSILLGTSAAPTGTAVLVGVDQRPTLDPSNISVTLT